MNSRERIRALFNNEPSDRAGFWLGHPADNTKIRYALELGIDISSWKGFHGDGAMSTEIDLLDIELASALGSDLFWCSPEIISACWKHPENKPMFDATGGKPVSSLSQPGVFADCTNVKEIAMRDAAIESYG